MPLPFVFCMHGEKRNNNTKVKGVYFCICIQRRRCPADMPQKAPVVGAISRLSELVGVTVVTAIEGCSAGATPRFVG